MIKKSTFVITFLVTVISFFSEHNTPARDTFKSVVSTDSAPRKKAKPQRVTKAVYHLKTSEEAQVVQVYARSTSYSHDEDGADRYTGKHMSKSQVPLVYLKNNKIGTAAISNTGVPRFGDLIITPDGRRFLAVDTGRDVKSGKASTELVDVLKKYQPQIDCPKYREAEIFDFYMENNQQVCNEWDTFLVVRNPENFMSLKVSERAEYLKPEKWQQALVYVERKFGVRVASN